MEEEGEDDVPVPVLCEQGPLDPLHQVLEPWNNEVAGGERWKRTERRRKGEKEKE